MGPFKKWCADNNIMQELASPYNPQGNGLAEAGVKNIKNLLAKCAKTRTRKEKKMFVDQVHVLYDFFFR